MVIKIKDNLVDETLLDGDEALLFYAFLVTEKHRHADDIQKIEATLSFLEDRFGITVEDYL